MIKISILALHLGYGGVEKSITTLANLLATKKDLEVEIVSIYKLYDKPVFDLSEKIKVKYLLPSSLSPNKEEFVKSLKQLNLIKAIKEGIKSIKILYLRKKEMIKYLKHSNSNIIISTRILLNEIASIYGSDEALKIGWEHNHHHNNNKYITDVIRSTKNLDYLVLVSKDLKRFYQRKLVNNKVKCVYIPNTIEEMPKVKNNLTKKRFISVGRLAKEKGFLDLLEIFKEIHLKDQEWTLDIIGDGKERKSLENYIEKNKLSSWVTLHGYQDSNYIHKMLNQSSLYIMTSYTESFGIVLLEAMSHGIPCIAFDSAEGAREIITSGRDGYLIRNRNKNAMIKKIRDLMKDEEKRKELGKAAREKIKVYSKDKVLEQWLKIIKKKGSE